MSSIVSKVFIHEGSGLTLGPQVAGHRLLRNDATRCFIIDDRIFHLTPSEYAVVLALLRQRERWERGQAPLWATADALAVAAGMTDLTLLSRYVRHASNKLTPAGISFAHIRGPFGELYQTLLQGKDIAKRSGAMN